MLGGIKGRKDKGKRESGCKGKEEGRKWFTLWKERNVKRAKLTIFNLGDLCPS